MTEENATCQIYKKSGLIQCSNPAMPGDPEGLCILHSHEKEKDLSAFREFLLAIWNSEDKEYYNFEGVFFPCPFDPQDFFETREFIKAASFFRATFTGKANFSEATFLKEADFSWANFMEEGKFFRAIFKMRGSFLETSFTKKAAFPGATFMDKAYFIGATFREHAAFNGATFTGESDFSWAIFMEDANFSRARIEDRMVFHATNSPKKGKSLPAFQGAFWYLELGGAAVLRFQDLSLAKVIFKDNDLRRVEFHHVAWHHYRGRQAIYDEVRLREEEKENPWFRDWFWAWVSGHLPLMTFALEIGHTADTTGRDSIGAYLAEEPAPPEPPWGDRYGQVERLYRYLKINYETENDFKNAGDFQYGEMEMHRRASKWRWFPFYWYNLYRWLSGYGERPSWALGWLAGFLLALPLLVWGVGLERVAGGTSPGFMDTFTYIFDKATFQRPPLLSNLNLLGTFISNLSLLIIPGQAALFLLALRNRLGRRR
jgi:uncharacterized protein YjbI with pentapeptide repeats